MRGPPGQDFQEAWRRRFERYGDLHGDDAAIAGWSPGGLAARFRRFAQLWERTSTTASGHWLDAGCGAGTYSRYLAGKGLQVTAVDYSYPTTRKARERGPEGVTWATADVTKLPFRDACFDGALCFGVMQALAGPVEAARELRRVLRPGAMVWIDALNALCLPSLYGETRRRLRRQAPHLRYDPPSKLRAALRANGFDRVERFWVPVFPAHMHDVQQLVERPGMQRTFSWLPPVGAALSHSFLVCARAA
jgi:SAM-dependent methyltransferase